MTTGMPNEELKEIYNEMHSKGSSSWFGDGVEEGQLILKMGRPWQDLSVLEIGCGKGELASLISMLGGIICAIGFRIEAITKAKEKYPKLFFNHLSYNSIKEMTWFKPFDRIVMQGVLEHFDKPFEELKWIMDNLLADKGDVITSSPCFYNTRGLIWMTLDLVGAVMSKTDLHFIDPENFIAFCYANQYEIKWQTCDWDWAYQNSMIEDLEQRIPLALKDGNLPYNREKFIKYMNWIKTNFKYPKFQITSEHGATAVYRIWK